MGKLVSKCAVRTPSWHIVCLFLFNRCSRKGRAAGAGLATVALFGEEPNTMSRRARVQLRRDDLFNNHGSKRSTVTGLSTMIFARY
jgi:hypothetical protein